MIAAVGRTLGVAALTSLLSACASVDGLPDGPLTPLSSPSAELTFAIDKACLPFLRDGVATAASIRSPGHGPISGMAYHDQQGPAMMLYGHAKVVVQEMGADACHVRVEGADIALMQRTALDVLAKDGITATPAEDRPTTMVSDPGLQITSRTYCLSEANLAGLLMTETATPLRTDFHLTFTRAAPKALGRDPNAPAPCR